MARRLVRCVLGIDDGDAAIAMNRPYSATAAAFCWDDTIAGLAFRAEGRVDATGNRDHVTVEKWLRSVIVEQFDLDGAGASGRLDLPLALGGFAFAATSSDPHAEWAGWPRASWWIPERLVICDDRGRAALVAQRHCDGEPGPAVVDELGRELHAWRRSLGKLPANHAGFAIEPRALAAGSNRREREDFVARVRLALEAIGRGELAKVVVARTRTLSLDGGAGRRLSPAAQWQALRRSSPGAIAFAWDRGREGAWLGATPEVLARVNNGKLTTAALAGTALAEGDPQAMLGCDKLGREHGLVAEAIAGALGRIGRNVRIAASPRLKRAEQLVHLETVIAADLLPGVGIVEAAAELHPTPALGGSPREAALAWLEQSEGFDRGYYGGPIGWLGQNGSGVLAVGIRAALVRGNRVVAYSGAGIVEGSDPELEWQETESKLAVALGSLRWGHEEPARGIEGRA